MQRDFSNIKNNEKQIIDDILATVNTQLFVDCLQPNAQSSRIGLLECGQNNQDYIQGSEASELKLTQSIQKQFRELGDIQGSKWDSTISASQSPKQIQKQQNLKNNNQKFVLKSQQKSQTSSKENQQLYENLLTAYKEHRIDQAQELAQKYIKKYPEKISQQQQQLFKTIELEYTTMLNFYNNFDEPGWIFDKLENGVKLEYKIFEQEKQIAIRIQSEFDVSISNFLAILCEMDLFGNYVPFCYDSKECKVISRNQKIGTSKVYIPCLTDRQTYFYAAGYDRYNVNGSVFLYSKTINSDILYQQKYGFKVPETSNYVRLEYKFFIVQYIPLTKTRAKVRLASKVDMKLNYLPQFIVNMSARKFAFDYFKNIIRVNKKFKGSEWQKKMKQNPDFYDFFRNKIDQYLGSK